jgi:predicted acyl esterase
MEGESAMIVQKDIYVATRDGSPICVDMLRPEGDGPFPTIVSMSPYGKDVYWLNSYPDHGFEISPEAVWETPDPRWWVPRGYALVRVDSRGIGKSLGTLDPLSVKDSEDYYDVIEWAGTQPWSNGRIGLLGISFYAIVQWKVAALQPPHLAGIIPWEGANDLYREWAYQGGIYTNGFVDFWWQSHWIDQPLVNGDIVDWRQEFVNRPVVDEWYHERSADLERIEVPTLSAGNWGAFHLHLRGNTEGFSSISSEHKRLVMMTGSHIDPFYMEWGKAEQLRFFDHWLKGVDNGAQEDPPVRLAIRSGETIQWRNEYEWPLARTQWRYLHLDASANRLGWETPDEDGAVNYLAPQGIVTLSTEPFSQEMEITGPVSLNLWLESTALDTDLFVALRQFDEEGIELSGIGPRGGPVPVAIGWLKASHRELDPERTREDRPWHTHANPQPLPIGRPTFVSVEIWPTSMTLGVGHVLRLEIRGNDDHMIPLSHNYPGSCPNGRITVLSGPTHDSHLVIPVIPFDPDRPFDGPQLVSAPERNVTEETQRGRVHTILANGRWAVELEGYGAITRHSSFEEALVAGRERAQRSRTEHVIHDENGVITETLSYGDRDDS